MQNPMSSLGRALSRANGALARWFEPPAQFADLAKDDTLAKPPEGEIAWASNLFFGSQPFEPWNPDELVAYKGHDIYKKMRRDDQVKAALRFVIDTIVSRKWRFETDEDNEQHMEMEQLFTFMLQKFMRGTFTEAMRGILDSKATGYSINELIFAPGQFEGKEYWLLKALKLRPYHTFKWEVDVYGNITSLIQERGSERKKLDPRKFIIHVSNPEMDSVFGESDLRAVYRWWWYKENVSRFWTIYLERMAGGFAVGKGGPTSGNQQFQDFKNVLNNLSSQTGIYVPNGADFELIAPPTTDPYQKAIDSFDMHITRGLLMPSRLGLGPEQNTGSFALADVQADMFMVYAGMQGDVLADTLNEMLFRALAVWNFGTDDFPRFVFEPYTEEQKREIVSSWSEAVSKGIVHKFEGDEARVRDLLGFDPLPDDVEYPDPFAEAEMAMKEREAALKGGGEGDLNPKNPPSPAKDKSRTQMSEGIEGPQRFPWRNRINLAEMESRFNSVEADWVEAMTSLTAQMGEAVRSTMADLLENAGETPDYEAITARMDASIPGNLNRKMNQAIREGLQAGYDNGRSSAIRELNRAVDDIQDTVLQQRLTLRAKTSRKMATRDKTWNVAMFVDGIGLEAALSYLEAKAFEITGVIAQAIRDKAKQVLLDAIKQRKTLKEMIEALEAVLGDVLPKTDAAGRSVNVPARLETIARTNLTDVFNQARLSTFTDPDMGDFVEGLEYSATLDIRTTEVCRRLDGRIYPINDPAWRNITPPNHFNCRSVLIPVTSIDVDQPGFAYSPPLPETVKPQVGFTQEAA